MDELSKKHGFRAGLAVFVEGAAIFAKYPVLIGYGLISILLTIISFVGMIFFLVYATESSVEAVSSWLGIENWGTLIRWFTYAGLAVGFFLFIFFTFVTFAGIISIPFMDMLSAGIEKRIAPHDEDAPFWVGIRRGVASSTFVMFKMLLIMVLSLPLLLIPVIGSVLFFFINAWYAGFGYLDYPMGRRGWSFREKKDFMKNAKKSQLIFGTLIYGMSMIPLLNLLIIPWATASATLLFLKIKDNSTQAQSKLSTIEDE